MQSLVIFFFSPHQTSTSIRVIRFIHKRDFNRAYRLHGDEMALQAEADVHTQYIIRNKLTIVWW